MPVWGDTVRLAELARLLDAEVVCGGEHLDAEVSSCFAADLMSDVLRFAAPHGLLITGLATIQAVRTADVADCRAIMLVNSKRPAPDTLDLARLHGMPILVTPHPMFEACSMLATAGLVPGSRLEAAP
jgi:predicted transcriptional regulator